MAAVILTQCVYRYLANIFQYCFASSLRPQKFRPATPMRIDAQFRQFPVRVPLKRILKTAECSECSER